MQREIKFRAWGNMPRNMIYFGLNGKPPSVYHDYPVMQFTGLLDCKGKEIYEGDIIGYYMVLGEHFTEEGQSMGVEWDGAKMIIDWDDKKARFNTPFSDTENLPVQLDPDSFEVIGNIYENPDLLPPAAEALPPITH